MRRIFTLGAIVLAVFVGTGPVSADEAGGEKPAAEGKVLVLVGHGIPALDFPKDKLGLFFRLSASQHSHDGTQASDHGHEQNAEADLYKQLEEEVRDWPRTPENDPYKIGVEKIAAGLAEKTGLQVFIGYNEFCAPTTESAVEKAVSAGATEVLVLSVMLTPGGGHSELDILHSVQKVSMDNPDVDITYAWPFDVDLIAGLMTEHLEKYGVTPDEHEAAEAAIEDHAAEATATTADHGYASDHPHEHDGHGGH